MSAVYDFYIEELAWAAEHQDDRAFEYYDEALSRIEEIEHYQHEIDEEIRQLREEFDNDSE